MGPGVLNSLGFQEGPNTLGISPTQPAYASVPNINFNNFGVGGGGAPSWIIENTYQVIDNFSKVAGTHTVKVGGTVRINQQTQKNLGSNGYFGFDGSETGIDFADYR
jgi:hypothetical protein